MGKPCGTVKHKLTPRGNLGVTLKKTDMNMKKVFIFAAIIAALASCEKVDGDMVDQLVNGDGSEVAGGEVVKTKKFTFTMKGGFDDADFSEGTRGYLSENAENMTDLWVFDFVDDECVQSLHQTAADENWGKPVLMLSYGSHHVYFVASAGIDPVIDTDAKTITWSNVRDTFWKDYDVEVVSTSNGNRAVTLDRVVTKLRVLALDEVPANCSTITLSPATWFNKMNYTTGSVADALSDFVSSVSIPSSYIGTSGSLAISMFSLSNGSWTTDVTLTAKDGNGDVIGQGTITAASMKSNRASEYSGNMFNGSGGYILSLDSEWETHYEGTW